jgi:hypothetical protein
LTQKVFNNSRPAAAESTERNVTEQIFPKKENEKENDE